MFVRCAQSRRARRRRSHRSTFFGGHMPPEYVMTEPSSPFTSLQNSSLARVLRGKIRAQDLANGRASESGVLGRRRATRAPRRGARRSSPRALSFALCSAMAVDEEEALRPGPSPPRSQQSRPRPTGVPHRDLRVFSTGDGRGAGEEADQAPPAQAGYLLDRKSTRLNSSHPV